MLYLERGSTVVEENDPLLKALLYRIPFIWGGRLDFRKDGGTLGGETMLRKNPFSLIIGVKDRQRDALGVKLRGNRTIT